MRTLVVIAMAALTACGPVAAHRSSGTLAGFHDDGVDVPRESITDDADERWGQPSARQAASAGAYADGYERGRVASQRMKFAMGYKLMGTPSVPDWLWHELQAEARPAEYLHGVEAGYIAGVKEIKRGRRDCLVMETLFSFFVLGGAAIGRAVTPH